MIIIRCGEEDAYHHFNTIEEVGQYLKSMGVSNTIEQSGKLGLKSKEFYGRNYISAYYSENPNQQVSQEKTTKLIPDALPGNSITITEIETLNKICQQ